jgi:hypothetical protein
MNKLRKIPHSQKSMIKFQNYGIEAYAIFEGDKWSL